MLTLNAKVTEWFFDREVVLRSEDRARLKFLSKAGAFVRTAARGSIRRRKAVSAPGSPPSAHSTDPNASIKKILFAYDPASRSTLVGPVALNMRSNKVFGERVGPGVVPNVLEFGGTMRISEWQRRDGTWSRSMRLRRPPPGRVTRVRPANYRARPFMGPALKRESPKFAGLWKNTITRS